MLEFYVSSGDGFTNNKFTITKSKKELMKTYLKRLKEYSLSSKTTDFPCAKITDINEAADYIRQFYSDDIEIYESFFILLLNRSNNTIGYAKISQGGVHGTIVDISILCKYAIESLCSGVIIAHNHPSGNTKPSKQDIELTHKVQKALDLFDIKLLDSVVLTKENHESIIN
jgi:DNA repair protein RadC